MLKVSSLRSNDIRLSRHLEQIQRLILIILCTHVIVIVLTQLSTAACVCVACSGRYHRIFTCIRRRWSCDLVSTLCRPAEPSQSKMAILSELLCGWNCSDCGMLQYVSGMLQYVSVKSGSNVMCCPRQGMWSCFDTHITLFQLPLALY